MVSIPAAAGKIHHRQWLGQIRQDQGFQFPQLRVRYILQSPQGLRMLFVSIPAVAGKIHCKNNESTLHICGTICAAFYLCLLYYRGSLKPCLPFAQKAKRIFPVFVFSRVRSPVL